MEQIITAVSKWWVMLPLGGKCAIVALGLLAVCVALMVIEVYNAPVDGGE